MCGDRGPVEPERPVKLGRPPKQKHGAEKRKGKPCSMTLQGKRI